MVTFFKPRGIPLTDLQEVCLAIEELEAVKLKELLNSAWKRLVRGRMSQDAVGGRIRSF